MLCGTNIEFSTYIHTLTCLLAAKVCRRFITSGLGNNPPLEKICYKYFAFRKTPLPFTDWRLEVRLHSQKFLIESHISQIIYFLSFSPSLTSMAETPDILINVDYEHVRMCMCRGYYIPVDGYVCPKCVTTTVKPLSHQTAAASLVHKEKQFACQLTQVFSTINLCCHRDADDGWI